MDKESQTQFRPSYKVGPYILDGRTREVKEGLNRIALTQVQFDVLYQLVERKGETVLRKEFYPWRREALKGDRHPVDMVVYKLRRLLDPEVIARVWGRGYRLSSRVSVETIASPSLSESEKQSIIALSQTNTHSGPFLLASIKNCETTLQRGPNAEAYVTKAKDYVNLGSIGFSLELPGVAFPKARGAIEEALEHFPDYAPAYAWKGLIALVSSFSWNESEEDFRIGLKLDPRDEYSNLFLGMSEVSRGLFDEGLRHVRIAAEVGFERGMTVITEPWCMLHAGRVGDALTLGEAVADKFSATAPVHDILGHIYIAAGAHKKAITEYEAALDIEFLPDALASLGYVYGKSGKKAAARECLRMLREAERTGKIAYLSAYYEALIFAGLNEREHCLAALEKAHTQKCDWFIYLKVEPRWSPVRHEKRFLRIMEQVGLMEEPESNN